MDEMSLANRQRKDLLKESRDVNATIGLQIGDAKTPHYSRRHIVSLIPGGPAYTSGQVAVGDEIVAVDGEEVTDETVVDRMRGGNFIGSRCVLTVRRKGIEHEVPLVRTSAVHVKQEQKKMLMINHLTTIAEGKAPMGDLLSTVQALILLGTDMERTRLEAEASLAEKLRGMQDFMLQQAVEGGSAAQQSDLLERSLSDSEGEATSLKRRIVDLEQTIEAQREADEALQAGCAKLTEDAESLRGELATATERATFYKAEMQRTDAAQTLLTEAMREAEAGAKETERLQARVRSVEAELAVAADTVRQLQEGDNEEMASMAERNQDLTLELVSLRDALEMRKDQARVARDSAHQFEDQVRIMTDTVEALSAQLHARDAA
eukprot:CAMPEP_0180304794 /NCGR_PEP_ID=MMETSP0988-20121125/26007_1 /TAXON_ID=697907 /ORGANISM="non described non described, Strain CCMP2293" /LENGTH=377 /DNA_ID=CAMNT_0022287033 /DNA_START=66 /DNA_END=1195 /DNA_ORIENTATION=+